MAAITPTLRITCSRPVVHQLIQPCPQGGPGVLRAGSLAKIRRLHQVVFCLFKMFAKTNRMLLNFLELWGNRPGKKKKPSDSFFSPPSTWREMAARLPRALERPLPVGVGTRALPVTSAAGPQTLVFATLAQVGRPVRQEGRGKKARNLTSPSLRGTLHVTTTPSPICPIWPLSIGTSCSTAYELFLSMSQI